MLSFSTILPLAAVFSLAHGHGVILAAQGEAGSPASIGFQVDSALARNCTSISPCQQDTTIIRDAEIKANIVNECGRTEINGNIDVGESTENAIAAGAVTKVTSGGTMTVTIHQVNADGAGPYSCDLDETSNSGTISQNLTVTNNVPGANGLSQAKTEDFNITVAMPDKLACTGGSTGNICTVRCRNNSVAGPFGGCVAVQQTDVKATANTPENIATAQKKAAVDAQVKQNKADLAVAVKANQVDGTAEQLQAQKDSTSLLGVPSVETKAQPATDTNTDAAANASNAAAAATPSATAAAGKKGAKGAAAAAGAAGNAATAKGAAAKGAAAKASKNNNKRVDFANALRWAKRVAEEKSS